MTTTTPSFSSDETLEAMLRQEAIYFTQNSNSSNNSKSSSMKQAVAALESIYELLSLQDRETLVIATSYLYRYYSNFNGQPSSISVSHIALVCFYMAVKIHQTTALPIKSLSDLHCRFFPDGSLPSSSWEWIELDVCTRLKWRLHPPMPMAFVDHSCHGNNSSRRQRKRAQSLLDQAFRAQPVQYVSGRHKPSSLAAAALFLTSRRGSLSPSSSTTTSTLTKEEEAAVAFLQEATATATTSVTTKQPRKRCVTPPPPPTSCMMLSHPPAAKKQRCGLMMGPASLRWTGSPRSAALMVEEEESF